MKRNRSRRAFLAGATASTIALAGCGALGISGDSTDSSSNQTDNGTNTNTVTSGSPQTTDTGDTTTETAAQRRDRTDRGESLDDFENLELWGTIQGEATAETNDVFTGSQSVRIQNPSGDAAGIFKTFPDGLDLTSHDLSIATKMEKPASGKLAVEVIAPARSDHLVCRRFIPEAMNDWMRVDLGYTGLRGNPNLQNVQELRIIVLNDGSPINYVVDDLRKVPKPSQKGRVILSFDDTRASQYDVAFSELKERGWQGMVSAIPDEINSNGALTTGELREMRDADWDVVSHPQTGTPLPELSEEEQRRAIRDTKEYLNLRGFREGKRFMTIPYGSYDDTTLELIDEFHEYGFAFGACPNTVPPVGTSAISSVSGSDLNGAARMINLAAKYNQLAVVSFGGIGPDTNVTKQHFNHLLDIIGEWESEGQLEVTTPSELLEMQKA